MKKLLPLASLILIGYVSGGARGAHQRAVPARAGLPIAATEAGGQPETKLTARDLQISPLETRVLGQRAWLRGGPASLRVIVTNHLTGQSVPAEVRLSLARIENGKPSDPMPLFVGQTDGVGTVDAKFAVPKEAPGPYQLTVKVDSKLGHDTIVQPVQLQESWQVLLSADKPLYQPGQTMHLRALALDMATRQALADKPVTFEVEDARGNKVYKKADKLSRFGVASTDFILADEVNMGTFTLRAVLPQGQTEKKVRVERYVLPKFKLTVSTDKPYYLPGEQVKGTVKATYFFGKPVRDAKVTLDVNTVDIGVTRLAEMKDQTDAIGVYTFRYKLPDSFVGQPFEQGKAVVEMHATLTDRADHKQEASLSLPVVKDPVQIVVVPESRTLVPDVENHVFIALSTPDGSPVKQARVKVTGAELKGVKVADLITDDLGLATYAFTPGKEPITLAVTATDAEGRTATQKHALTAASGPEGIILRPDKTLAKVGDRLNLLALSSSKGGTLYLDVIRNKQTILTRAEPMSKGQAHLFLPLSADMVGTLVLHAYKILPNENIIRDTRTIVVSPADDLNIRVTTDKTQYRPGGDAVLHFTVEDQQKHPVLAALGLAVVDESVFGLSEMQPGLEKIYFTLEKEFMEPKYEIHGLTPTNILHFGPGPVIIRNGERQRAAAMLLAAAPPVDEFDLRVNTFTERWAKVQAKVTVAMMQAHRKITSALQKYRMETGGSLTADESLMRLVDKGILKETDLLDPWGHFYRANLYGQKTYDGYFALSSAGPDNKWDTNDDIVDVTMYGRNELGMPWGVRSRGGFGGGAIRFKAMAAGALGDKMELGVPMAEERAFNGAVAFDAAAPAPMRAVARMQSVKEDGKKADGGGAEPARVRSYFPETMYWNPALITDEEGHALITIPMADSITTWRLSMMANSLSGQLGSATAPIKVFQDFFVDIDLPVSLTQHDRVEVPVAVYNYLSTPQEVTVTLKKEPWFKLDGSVTRTVKVDANQVGVVSYPITADSIGKHALEVTAHGGKLADAQRRQVEVTPDGKLMEATINDRLDGNVVKTMDLPAGAIPGASNIWVKLYPGAFSQVVEGLDGILRMPNGCFEQTSSTTYPNLLVLDYLKRTKHINPELQMKAEGYINIGYQRLVTFECKNGGFSWFGDEPAHQVLTAYGLLEFSDMSKVHEVDPNVILRTQMWLAGKQQPDGSWEEKGTGIAEGIINRQTGALRTTAYIAWALAESGFNGPQLNAGVAYVKAHKDEAKDPYTLAVMLNLLSKVERDGEATAAVANALVAMAKVNDKAAYWQSDTKTFTGAEGQGADLEATGLAAYGLSKWGRNGGFTSKVLTYLVQSKDSFGTWQSTQGTVWAMKALLYASENGTGGKGTVTILANGQKAGTFKITPEDSDVMRQVSLAENVRPGANAITLQYDGDGSLLYQLVERYYIPWQETGAPRPGFEPLSIKVDYDKTTLAQDDTATVTVKVTNTTDRIAEMPLIDLGVPPGFTVNPEKLDAAVTAKSISKYTLAVRQIIVYLEKLDPGQTVTLTYQVRAKYPIKARTPLSRVYPYYNPEKVAVSAPQDIVVTK